MKNIKNWTHNRASELGKVLDSNFIRRIKIFLLIAFILLAIADVVFVMLDNFPTISQVVQDSSPKFVFFIWLFGVATANLFFPRTPSNRYVQRVYATSIMLLILLGFITWGIFINNTLTCDNFKTKKSSFIFQTLCLEKQPGQQKALLFDCNTLSIENCQSSPDKYKLKIDFKTSAKLLIVLFGFLCGFFLWPQILDKEDKLD